ncbi:hypothetical protein KKC22_04765 [Myxococcota bacterium]|nr:hypothetical protein [Myxococcota bacterium]
MKYFFIFLLLTTSLACDSEDKLTQADCEMIQDMESCTERGCAYQSGFEIVTGCGGTCHFTSESTSFSRCFLSDGEVREEVWVAFYRAAGEQYQIILLNHHIGNLSGWTRGKPECITCTADLWVENP